MLCVGLAGMAVGLGAMMPNFHEQSPSKIAAGFGGTLNLVLGALYILLIVGMTALPCHFFLLSSHMDNPPSILRPSFLILWLTLGISGSLLLTCLATVLPLRSGLRAFRQLEV